MAHQQPAALHWVWSTPRSVSTALERSLLGVEGLANEHEPYTDVYHYGPQRRSDRYGQRCEQARNPLTAHAVESLLRRRRQHSPLLVKELAFQGEPYVPDALLRGTRAIVLTRRPQRVHASLAPLKPDYNEEELGFSALLRLTQRLERLEVPRLFVDGDTLQREPARTMQRVCAFLQLPYSQRLLQWQNGAIRHWELHEQASQAVWHGKLEASSGLQITTARPRPVSAKHRGPLYRAEQTYERLRTSCLPALDVADAV